MDSLLPSQVSKKFWPFLLVLFLLFLGMGFYGWKTTLEQAHVDPDLGTVIEQTINLVTGEEAIVVSQKYEEDWTLKVAKWGIKGVLAAALFQSALMIFGRQIKRWRFKRVSNHEVFAGIGLHNLDLALMAASQGRKVAIVSEDEEHPRRSELEAAGVLFLSGSPSDPQKLRIAGVDRAARVVVAATGGDNASISAAEAVDSLKRSALAESPKGQMLVCVDSNEIRELLNQRWGLVVKPYQWQARVVSFDAVAMRQIITSITQDLAKSPEILTRGPRILLAGDDGFTMHFLRAAIPFLQISGNALPEFFATVDGEVLEKDFQLLYPAAGLVAKVNFILCEDRLVPVCPELEGLKFDLAVVKLQDESSTLQLASKILASSQFFVDRVHAVLLHPPEVRLLDDPKLQTSSIFKMGLQSSEFGDLSLEQKARENHEAYLAGLKPEERAKAQEYDALGEAFKESNRCAVLHREIKKGIWSKASENEREHLIEHLAICEHQRWTGEKVMDGWRGGEKRDNQRKIHPDIRPYDYLSEEVKEKDRVQVRKGLGL